MTQPEPPVSLTPAMFQVLLTLADGEKHGYAILKEVEGLIQECRNRPPAEEDDQRRRYYRLTPFGRHLAMDEAERMEKLIATARAKHLLRRLKPA